MVVSIEKSRLMKRRDFLKSTTGVAATLGFSILDSRAQRDAGPTSRVRKPAFPRSKSSRRGSPSLSSTRNCQTSLSETIELGKKSILDGLGLALSGSKAETAAA